MKVHEIKCERPYFNHAVNGWKKFECRKDDRNYQVGDWLILCELRGEDKTGREITVEVTYKLAGGKHGIDAEYCILGTTFIDSNF